MTARITTATFWWTLGFLVSAAAGCAYALVHHGPINRAKVEQVEQGLAKLRGLNFTAPVPLVIKTPEQAQRMMVVEMARDHSDEQLRISGQAGSMVGLFPNAIDLKAETLKLLRSQIAAFYDPIDKQTVLVRGAMTTGLWNSAADFVSQRDIVGEMLVAHELTHALQDQHFAIESMLDKVKDNDDRTLALKSVAEGDATLAGFAYVVGGLQSKGLDAILSRLADLPQTFTAQTKAVPEGLSAPLLFQYSGGVRFVAEAYRRGGWTAVNALYRKPPLSSQQIMKPALYFDRFSAPTQIDLSGYQTPLPGWSKIDTDTYGELLLKVIFERSLGQHAPEIALLSRWAGDRMVVLRNGKSLMILWLIAFQNGDAAGKFANAYQRLLDSLPNEHFPHRVESRSNAVLVMIGPAAHEQSLTASIWKSTRIFGLIRASPPPTASAEPAQRRSRATLRGTQINRRRPRLHARS